MYIQEQREQENYTLLVQAISHFDNTSALDNRCYFMTIKLLDREYIQNLYIPIYQRVTQVFGNEGHKDGINRPGLILSGDVYRSQYGDCNHLDPIDPHIHGLLFIPIDTLLTEKEIIESIKAKLQPLRELTKNAVWINKFDTNRKHLVDTIGYNLKAIRSRNGQHVSDYKEAVFPHDLDMRKGGEEVAASLFKRVTKLHKELTSDHSPFFEEASQKGPTQRQSALNRTKTEKLDESHVAKLVRKFQLEKGIMASK